MVNIEKQIKNTQDILHLLRQSTGLSTAELGKKIGISRQQIGNIENKKCKLNKTVYFAMRYAFLNQYPNNHIFNDLVYIFIDHYDEFNFDELSKIKEYAGIIVPSLSVKNTNKKPMKDIYDTWNLLLASINIKL